MTAPINTLAGQANEPDHQKVLSEFVIDDYQYLLDLSNDAYIAALETHLISLEQSRNSH
jgi:hypothetical protein